MKLLAELYVPLRQFKTAQAQGLESRKCPPNMLAIEAATTPVRVRPALGIARLAIEPQDLHSTQRKAREDCVAVKALRILELAVD